MAKKNKKKKDEENKKNNIKKNIKKEKLKEKNNENNNNNHNIVSDLQINEKELINNNNNNNNNKKEEIKKEPFNFSFPSNSLYYSIEGEGNLLSSKNLSLQGHNLIPNKIYSFNYNSDYPIFKYSITNPSTSLKITNYNNNLHIFTQNKTLNHLNFIPNKLKNFNFNQEINSIYLIGEKNSGKNVFLPFIINSLLNYNNKIYLLELDCIHNIAKYNFCISLIEINSPLLTNNYYLNVDNNNIKIIHNFYIKNYFDLENYSTILNFIMNNFKNEKIVINCFSFWDNNANLINEKIIFEFFNENKRNFLFIFKNKNEEKNFNEKIFSNNNKINYQIYSIENYFDIKNDNTTCELTLSEKKKNEEFNLLNFHFKNGKNIKININKIHFLEDNILYSIEISKEKFYESFYNKFCEIINFDLNYFNNNNNKILNIKNINYIKRELIGYCKIKEMNFIENYIILFTNDNIDIEKDYFILVDNLLEKIIRKNKKDYFLKTFLASKLNFNLINNNNNNNNNIEKNKYKNPTINYLSLINFSYK